MQISSEKIENRIITLARPSIKKHISDKWRFNFLLLLIITLPPIEIFLLYVIVVAIDIFPTLIGIVILITGSIAIVENIEILKKMLFSDWIFEYNKKGKLPTI